MALDRITADGIVEGSVNAASIAANSIPSSKLTTTGVTAGTYGNSSQVPVLSVDAAGRLTNATTVSVAGVTGFSYAGANTTFTISTADGGTYSAAISANSIAALAIGSTGVTSGTYGNTTAIPVITIDEDGRISNATTTSVSGVTGVSYSASNNTLSVATSTSTFNAVISSGNSSVAGVLQIADSTANTSETVAATANSVKTTYTYAGTIAGTAYSNAVSTAATDASSKAATAYSNAATYALTQAGIAYANATGYADTKAATAYTNATSYADTKAATAYSNATSYADTKAATAYTNATSYADTKAATAYSNATSYAATIAGTAYTNATAFAANATNITSGTLTGDRIQANNGVVGNTSGVFVRAGTGVTVNATGVHIGQDVANTANVAFNNITITGNLIVQGTTTTVNTQTLSVQDNMIYLNANSITSNPDLGFAGNYNDGTYAHAGVFRDATDGVWKFFHQYTPEPDASPYIDTANATFAFANVQANTFIGNLTGSANSATYVGGNTALDLRTYSDTKAATAYTNATSYADTKAATAYTNATSYAATIAGTAYTNATSYADTKAATAYTNATSFASNASNISTGTLAAGRLPQANTSSNGAVIFLDSVSNTATSIYAPTMNAVKTAYDNAGTAYSNATSYAATIAGTAYSNATSYAATIAGTAYTNAVSYAASNSYVNSTFLKLAGGTMTGALVVSNTSTLGSSASQYTRFGTYGSLLSTDTHISHNFYYNGSWQVVSASVPSSSIRLGTGSSNQIDFMYAPAGTAAPTSATYFTSGGIGQTTGSWRAPIFYDSDNTAYYLDPSSNSYLNSTYFDFAPSTVNFRITTGSGTFNIGDDDIVNLGTSASARSPIFYDYNDTGYYVNPNGSSNIYSLTLASTLTPASPTGWWATAVTSLTGAPIRIPHVGVGTTARFVPAVHQSVGYDSGYYTHTSTGIYKDANGWGAGYYIAIGGNDSYPTQWYQFRYDYTLTTSAGYLQIGGNTRSELFYDSNNTAYYVDPASGTNLGGTITQTGPGRTSSVGPSDYDTRLGSSDLWFWFKSIAGNGSSGYPGAIQFGRNDSVFVWPIVLNPRGGNVGINSYSADYTLHVAGNGYASSDFRAPIFYDSSDTTYYLDPNSNSLLYGLRVARGGDTSLYLGTGDTSRTYNDGSTRAGISITGYAYPHIDINATSSGNATHGGVFSFTGELSSGGFRRFGINVANYNPNEMSFGWYDNNTNPHYGVGINWSYPASIWFDTGHHLYARGSMRAPIFYDQDDTNYYVDPASTSVLNAVVMYNMRPYVNRWHTSSTDGTSRFYFGNAGRTYFGSADGFEWRSSSDNNIGILDNAGVFLNYASVRSPIFYDYNDTGYYVDPASTSVLNILSNPALSDSKLYLRTKGDDNHYLWNAGDDWEEMVMYQGTGFRVTSSAGGGTLLYCYGSANGNYVLSSTSFRAPIFYDSDNTGYYLDPTGTSSASMYCIGVWYFRSNPGSGVYVGSTSGPPLQAYSNDGGAAYMSFHRSNAYAVNMGLDPDNVLRIGGWSASSNRFQMDMSGNLTMAGNVTAYSDIRVKENISVIQDALNKIKKIRGVTFTRTDHEDTTRKHAGVIAQEVEQVLPEVVSEDNQGMKNVAYGNMVSLLIEAIKDLTNKVEMLEERAQTISKQQVMIDRLESLVQALINKTGD